MLSIDITVGRYPLAWNRFVYWSARIGLDPKTGCTTIEPIISNGQPAYKVTAGLPLTIAG